MKKHIDYQQNLIPIYFTVEGGMDFRAMLMKRKKPAKKVVVVRISSFLLLWLFDTFLVQIQFLNHF